MNASGKGDSNPMKDGKSRDMSRDSHAFFLFLFLNITILFNTVGRREEVEDYKRQVT